MKTAFILAFILLLLSINANSQAVNSKIDKLSIGQLKLPKESANKALILDGAGQVKSSSTITDTELGYLEGLTDTLVNLLTGKANDGDVVKLTGNQDIDGVKTFEGKLVASSTVNGSIPCPVMTETQRDAFTPIEGDCVYNSDTLKLNVFDGSVWKDVGGAGGISLWLTANPYNVNDIIIESDKIYRCLIAHTSSVFATDLGSGNWVEVSSGLQSPVALADGGTGVAITPTAGSIVYVDADSFEQVSGTSGQVLQSNGSGAPTFVNKSISAKSLYGSSVTAEEIQVPNNLLTQTDSNKHLNETGNKNILANPSFEHSTFSTSWVNSAGTFSQETSIVIDGKASAKLVLSSETMSLSQSSTLYQAQFADGVQGLVSVRVKSGVALKVCSIQAGVVSTSNCVDVQANNKWGLYKVPMILGSTSNGISIASTGAVSGTVYIDDAFVGAASLTQEMNACQSVNCETTFGIIGASGGGIVSQTMDIVSSCSRSGTGTYTCTFKSGVFTQAPSVVVGLNTGVNCGSLRAVSVSSSSFTVNTANGSFGTLYDCQYAVTVTKTGADFTAAKQLSNGNTYSSTNADTDWASCNFSTLAWQGLGTVNPDLKCKRNGSDILIRGRITIGTVAASQARFPLPIWNGVQLTSASSISATEGAGGIYRGSTANGSSKFFSVLAIPSVSYFSAATPETASTTNPLVAQNGSNMFGSSEIITLSSVRIPIEGWQQSNIIIGQFNGLESCTNTLECTDVFSAKISSTGVVSSENVDFINGNCAKPSTGIANCSFKSGVFTQTPVCVANRVIPGQTTWASNDTVATIGQISSSGVYVLVTSTSQAALEFNLICQKQGVDYVGKTAKAVASDQNVATPGVTNSVVYSATISGSDVVTSENGDFISGTSCTNATTGRATCTLNAGAFSQTPICSISTGTQGLGNIYCAGGATSPTNVEVYCQNAFSNTPSNAISTIVCHGIK